MLLGIMNQVRDRGLQFHARMRKGAPDVVHNDTLNVVHKDHFLRGVSFMEVFIYAGSSTSCSTFIPLKWT